jgi:hypothetical protein
MEYTEIDVTLDKLRIHSTHTSSYMNSSATSMGTGATDLESDESEAALYASFNASMDFDRHTMHGAQRQRFDDSESFNWEDSFALDDGQPVSSDLKVQLQIGLEPVLEQRLPLRSTALEPVMEPCEEDDDGNDENANVTSENGKSADQNGKSAGQRYPTQNL